jgi:SpoVK/Ycf46/Vps4 family AAA+-type ATPase
MARDNRALGWAPRRVIQPTSFAVTLSGLLNVLDGFHAPENVVYVMTTNKVEALDPALLRPGRIDYRLFMGEASASQRIALYRRFFPAATEAEARDFAQAHCAETMAEFQGLLLALEQGGEDLRNQPDSLPSCPWSTPASPVDSAAIMRY